MRPEQTAIARELGNARLREELEDLEEQVEAERKHDDPSVQAELESTRQKRGKK